MTIMTADLVGDGVKLAVQLSHGDRLGIDRFVHHFLVLLVSLLVQHRQRAGHSRNYRRFASKRVSNQHKPVKMRHRKVKYARLFVTKIGSNNNLNNNNNNSS